MSADPRDVGKAARRAAGLAAHAAALARELRALGEELADLAITGPPLPGYCKRGHPFTPENTYRQTHRDGSVGRSCKECRRAQNRRAKTQRKATP